MNVRTAQELAKELYYARARIGGRRLKIKDLYALPGDKFEVTWSEEPE